MRNHIQKIFIIIVIAVLVCGCQSMGQSQPTATTVPTAIAASKEMPFDWPISPLTREQIQSVEQCDIENLSKQRYPSSITSADLLATEPPQTDCDWAILAMSYANRTEDRDRLPTSARQIFTHAVKNNAGYALATLLFYGYFGTVEIVKSPFSAQQEITDVKIKYSWDGLGDKVDYSVEIHQANTSPLVTSTRSVAQ